ncbi:MAG TPA: alginate export family protein, partial [Opitutus sp.]|nr:alginate export family protein [Opitutus sp.]
TSYYFEAGSSSTQRESDPPSYVRNLGSAGNNDLAWLDLGLQQRVRYEARDDDIRRFDAEGFDDPWLTRTRVFVGLRNRLDPLRLALEFQDSRRHSSRFASDNRDVNKTEFIQAYAELYFADAFGVDPRGNQRPLSLRYGRHAFELLDRRLVGRNEWRNTTNTFEGLRASIGQQSNDWQLEFVSLHPVTRLLDATDSADRNVRFNALIGHWRRSPRLAFEPHYFHLRQDASAANGNRARDIHAPGLRVYGKSADGAINLDASLMKQFGNDGVQDHAAWSVTAETGYTWLQHAWRPRLAAFYGYASGDRNPADGDSNRFERFFGFARPWSASDYVIYENLHAP